MCGNTPYWHGVLAANPFLYINVAQIRLQVAQLPDVGYVVLCCGHRFRENQQHVAMVVSQAHMRSQGVWISSRWGHWTTLHAVLRAMCHGPMSETIIGNIGFFFRPSKCPRT